MNAFRARQREAKGRIDVLPPQQQAGTRNATAPRRRFEVVDADFVVIAKNAEPRAARMHNDNRQASSHRRRPSVATTFLIHAATAAARICERFLQLLPGRAFAGIVAFAFLAVFSLAGGLAAIKTTLPAPAQEDPLRISDVTATLGDSNGMKVLAVYGRIDNRSAETHAVPTVMVDILSSGKVTRREVAASVDTLPSGGSDHFALRVPHSGGKMPKVSVSFAPQDAPAD